MSNRNYVVWFMCLLFFLVPQFSFGDVSCPPPPECPSNCSSWELLDTPQGPEYYMWDVANCYMGILFDYRWIAVGSDGRIWYFSDDYMGGLTCSTNIEFPNHAYTITSTPHEYFDRRYVAAGHGGFIYTTEGLDIRIWDEETSPVTTHLYASVYNSDADKFVLVGQAGKVVTESPTGWIQAANAGAANIWNITYGNGKYVLCNVAGWVYTSTDLNSWTKGVQLDCINAKTAVFGDGVYLIGGKTNDRLQVVYRSTDTINWTQHIMTWNENEDYVYDLVYTGSKFYGVARNKWIIESEDGITWTKTLSPAYPTMMMGIAYSCEDGAIIAVGGPKSIHSECTQ